MSHVKCPFRFLFLFCIDYTLLTNIARFYIISLWVFFFITDVDNDFEMDFSVVYINAESVLTSFFSFSCFMIQFADIIIFVCLYLGEEGHSKFE